VQDTYHKGADYHFAYDALEGDWLSFNRLFFVVYPPDRETDILAALGPYADAQWANERALELAAADTQRLTGAPLYFAWFAQGTSLVGLQRYVDAAHAFDAAFSVYATLDPDYGTRPWRMLWYQTGPYWAYYYSGRYYDVINLADATLNDTSTTPTLEESLYWRGLAKYALGDVAGGIEDVRRSVYYNMNFAAGIGKLQEWGVIP
jgi:tetratricopeptide (TPR) repeat protein